MENGGQRDIRVVVKLVYLLYIIRMTIPDRLELLETFVRVADTGALSRAARSLHVSQPSVSRRIQSLEDACGAKLIHRTTHYLELTDEGRRLLPVARELLSKWEAGVSALADNEPSGLLRVAAPVGLGQSRLVDEAVAYLKRYPKVQMGWTLTDAPVDVVGGEADIWIRIGAVTDDRLVVKQLAKVDRFLVAAPDLARSASRWTDLPAVSLSPFYGAELTLFNKRGKEQRHRPHIVLASDNIAAVKRAVLQGAGAALLPDWLVAAELKDNRLTRVAPNLKGAPLDIVAAYAPERGRPSRLRLFIDQLTKGFQKGLA